MSHLSNAISIYSKYSSSYIIDVIELSKLIEENINTNIDFNNENIISKYFLSLGNTIKNREDNIKIINEFPCKEIFRNYIENKEIITNKGSNKLRFVIKKNIQIPEKWNDKDINTENINNDKKNKKNKNNNENLNINIPIFNINLSTEFKNVFNINIVPRNLNDVYKYIYKYIYDNYLQDKNNKWIIHPDNLLKKFINNYDDTYTYTYKNIKDHIKLF